MKAMTADELARMIEAQISNYAKLCCVSYEKHVNPRSPNVVCYKVYSCSDRENGYPWITSNFAINLKETEFGTDSEQRAGRIRDIIHSRWLDCITSMWETANLALGNGCQENADDADSEENAEGVE